MQQLYEFSLLIIHIDQMNTAQNTFFNLFCFAMKGKYPSVFSKTFQNIQFFPRKVKKSILLTVRFCSTFLLQTNFSCIKSSFSCFRTAYSDLEHTKNVEKNVNLQQVHGMQGQKEDPGTGTFKNSPGTFRLLQSWDHGTTGSSRYLCPILSGPVLGPSRDLPGRDSPAGKPSTQLVKKSDQNANLVNRFYLVNMLTRVLGWSNLDKNVLT